MRIERGRHGSASGADRPQGNGSEKIGRQGGTDEEDLEVKDMHIPCIGVQT